MTSYLGGVGFLFCVICVPTFSNDNVEPSCFCVSVNYSCPELSGHLDIHFKITRCTLKKFYRLISSTPWGVNYKTTVHLNFNSLLLFYVEDRTCFNVCYLKIGSFRQFKHDFTGFQYFNQKTLKTLKFMIDTHV